MKFLSQSVAAGDAARAVSRLREAYAGFPVKTLFFFASSHYNDPGLAGLVRDAFPGAATLGCSSYGEITGGGIKKQSIAALAFGPGALDAIACAAVENISAGTDGVAPALAELERQLGGKLIDLDYERHFGLNLFNGSFPPIEGVLERLGDSTNLTFIGGYASDDFSMGGIRQYLNGKTYADAAVLAILKPAGPFSLLKTQSSAPMGKSVTVTRADPERRVILELDRRPALEVYAEHLGLPAAEVDDRQFLVHPFGIMADNEPFLRSIQRILPDRSLQLFCSVQAGQRLFLMRTLDIAARTAETMAEKRRQLGGEIKALLDFDCVHRSLILEKENRLSEYSGLFAGIEAAGFVSFGECYIAHINQTAVMALFG
ncbi:MAG: FIST C-terminal domain-containing protein [Planctomycetota bacterium]|jgi:hypothetical protein|nr:FIST C-terminal domain-containing protein [Planctomycetota bacterium]